MVQAIVLRASDEDLTAALLEAGCRGIVTATTLDEVLAVLARDRAKPSVIVVDHEPALDACRRLASSARGVPIVVITAVPDMQAAFEAGANDCIARPPCHAEIVARVRTALRLRTEHARRSRRDRRLTDELRVLQRQNHELELLACVDSLTGIANRRHALALLHAEWKRSARDGTPLSVVMIDLDFFHAFNEHYGHPGGDGCLRRVTAEMVGCLRRPSDVLGRYGGEEFVAVLAGTRATGARIVAERMRRAVEALAIPHERSGCASTVTISVGYAECHPADGHTVDGLIGAADRALLAAKASGRNRCHVQVTDRRPLALGQVG